MGDETLSDKFLRLYDVSDTNVFSGLWPYFEDWQQDHTRIYLVDTVEEETVWLWERLEKITFGNHQPCCLEGWFIW